jgi:hypothetical protein
VDVGTTVYFAAPHGDSVLSVRVEEDPEEVLTAWNNAARQPFVLSQSSSGKRVWINPASVAYWAETPTARTH